MVRYDCRFCTENVFDVVDIEHLDTLPRTWVCSGCGRKYTGELDEEGRLIVYLKGYKRTARVYEEPGLTPIEGESEPGEDETEPGEDEQYRQKARQDAQVGQTPDPGESAQEPEEPPEPGESAQASAEEETEQPGQEPPEPGESAEGV